MKKCSICGKELKHQGALNIHTIHCERRQYKAQNTGEKACEHEYRLLSSNNAVEGVAITQGFGEVCKKCQELR